MTQPVASVSKLADSNDNPQIAERGASVAVPTDLATSITAITAIIERLEAHGLIADN
jgi:hypothetical protein